MFLGVPATLCLVNDKERMELAGRVEKARMDAGLSKEAAAKEAEVTATTWRRVENGLRVHDHKLAAILEVVGIDLAATSNSPEVRPNEVWSESTFVLPPEIELGYQDVVRYSKALKDFAPPLSRDASRLMLDAARLFAEAGQWLLAHEGGDGNADSDKPGGSAPIGGAHRFNPEIYNDKAADSAKQDPVETE